MTSMWKREGEVVEMVARRRLDFCCIQESRWKGEGAKVLGSKSMKCKFFWKGCDSGYAGVGVIVSERWISQVIEVRRVSERIIVLRVAIGKMVINVISAYAPQVNLSMEEKEDFWVRMIETVSSIGPGERVLIGGDLNGHVGAESSGYEDVHGGFGFGDRNVEGEMILESAEAMGMIIANTWFKKNGTEKKVTFERDNCKTAIDFIMVRKSERSMITDVNVIKTEAFIPQHKLLICKVRLFEKTVRSRQAFVSRTKVWRLKEEAVQNKFKEVVERMEVSKNTVDSGGSVEVLWSGFRDCMTEAAEHVCGQTKGRQVHHETWWWNDEVDRAVSEKRDWYRIWSKSKTEANKMVYNQMKKYAGKVVYSAKESYGREFGMKLENEAGKGNLFKAVKRIVRQGKDVVGNSSMKNTRGELVTDESEIREVWSSYFEKLLNEEFEWNRDFLKDWQEDESSTAESAELITEQEVKLAIKQMKKGKAAGPSGVTAEMLQAAGEAGIRWVTGDL